MKKHQFALKTVLLLVCCLLVVTAFGAELEGPHVSLFNVYQSHPHKGHFDEWAKKHRKEYHNDQIGGRFQAWLDNLAKIEQHNAEPGKHSYSMGLNEYSDLTWEEFKAKFLLPSVPAASAVPDVAVNSSSRLSLQVANAPAAIDWRSKGVVTPITRIDRGSWTAATAAVMETTWALSGRSMSRLSAQQMLDCNTNGDGLSTMLDWVINKNKGLVMSDHRYPTTGAKKNCLYSADQQQTMAEARFMRYHQNTGTEEDMVRILTSRPVAVCMNIMRSFVSYSSGVYDEPDCNTMDAGVHCFAIMGYGTDNGRDYWLVKNSWSTAWGESGYMRFIRGVNRCNIKAGTYLVSHPDGPTGFSSQRMIVGEPGESCTIACARRGRKCTLPINTFSSDEMIKMNGIECTHDQRGLFAGDQPCFVSDSRDPNGNYGKCLGVAEDYSGTTTCDASFWSVRRLCRCEALTDRDYLMGTAAQTCTQACAVQRNTGCDTNIDELDSTVWSKLPAGTQNPGWDWCCADQPSYVSDRGDGNYNRVLGLSQRPRWRDCEGHYYTVNPLCHCRPHYYLGRKGDDCDQTCKNQDMLCEPINYWDMGDSVQLFKDLGVNCDTSTGSDWFANDQPAWVTDPNDPNKNYNKCLGFKKVPSAGAPCNAKFWSVNRLCKCKKK